MVKGVVFRVESGGGGVGLGVGPRGSNDRHHRQPIQDMVGI